MSTFKVSAKWTGIFFLVSDLTSIVALALYQPLLSHADFVTSSSANAFPILLGAFFEILLAISVTGTALTLYPLLKKQNQSMALGYVIGRAMEATIILVGVMSLLTILTMRQDFLSMTVDSGVYQAMSSALIGLHDWTFLFGPNIILALNATLIGYLLYKSRVVPKWIALLALIDGPVLFVSGIAIVFGAYAQTSSFAAILALPMFIFEVSFAIRLITKGFTPAAVDTLDARS